MKKRQLLAAALACAWLAPAYAQLNCNKSFGFRADVGTTVGQTLCSSTVTTFIDAAKNLNLSNPGYTNNSAATVAGRISDVSVILRYDANSSALHYNFPELGMTGNFNGGTRDLSEEQFVEYLKKTDIIGRIMNYQAKHSPTSALTGQGGAFLNMAGTDFGQAFDTASQIAAPGGADSTGNNNLIGVGLSYGSYNINGSGDRVKSTNLPLSYTIRNDKDSRQQLVFSVPLSMTKIGDADVYQAGLGLTYRQPITSRWTLSPGVRFTAVGSVDRATVSTVMSANVMSTYLIPAGAYTVAIGNMVGLYRTGKISSGDYSFDPDISATLLRNGVMLSMPTGATMATEVSLIDTRYAGGDKPYVRDTQEVGITVGTNRNAANARSFLRAGVSYVHSKDSKGFTVNLGYWF
ncbi:hypothetical protein [Pseudoduganella sp.]|uniref:hypothetical protein n=1 Tax=Pseudoduganella sp. TaxID=1880898 RepID=UPI0035B23BF2